MFDDQGQLVANTTIASNNVGVVDPSENLRILSEQRLAGRRAEKCDERHARAREGTLEDALVSITSEFHSLNDFVGAEFVQSRNNRSALTPPIE